MKLPEQNHLPSISCVGTIFNVGSIPNLATIQSSCDFVEIRLDQIHPHTGNAHFINAVREIRDILPIILTARHPAEGGHHHLGIQERTDLIKAYLEFASYVDIELNFWEENQFMVDLVRAAKVPIIGSTHDFKGPPNLEKLAQSLALGKTYEVEITKIAVQLHQVEELAALCAFMKTHQDTPLSIMGMGKLGPVSRLLFAQHGSRLNYGFLEKANAPGQLPVHLMKKVLLQLESLA